MATQIPFDRSFPHEPGDVVELSPLVRRITAPNPSLFTFKGTNSYIVGRGRVALIDPGPEIPEHVARIEEVLEEGGETISHVLVTHTHRDHSPGVAFLEEVHSAPTYGYGPHGTGARHDWPFESPEGGDLNFQPQHVLHDGEQVKGDGWTLMALYTPGHISNHLCFALEEEKALFSGDHVMGWSTSIVSPPDGDMRQYMESLEKVLKRDDVVYYPGHGGPITEPKRLVEAFIAHRREREEQILELLRAGPKTIPEMVESMYADVARELHRAAGRSVLSHLLHMWETGRVAIDGHLPGPDDVYRLA